jgi:hypothetical protein
MSKKPYYRGERDLVWSKRGLQFLLAYLRSSVDQQMLLRPTMEQKRPTVEAKETYYGAKEAYRSLPASSLSSRSLSS